MNTPFEFLPHRLVRGGHAQTLLGRWWPGPRPHGETRQHIAPLPDGDGIVVHDNQPQAWPDDGQIVLLLHGLCGSHASAYMDRTAARLLARGVRVMRLDLRACGAGLPHARRPFHAGRSDDIAAVLTWVISLAPRARLFVVGFSLGGAMALKLAGEYGEHPPAALAGVMGLCPPVDLAQCARGMQRRGLRAYDRYFARLMVRQATAHRAARDDAPPVDPTWRPPTLWDFDEGYTAPVNGFDDARDYYRQCSAEPWLPAICVPTVIVAAEDDPLIPGAQLRELPMGAAVQLHTTKHGGHLGYIGRANGDPDRRWLDWRIVDWVMGS